MLYNYIETYSVIFYIILWHMPLTNWDAHPRSSKYPQGLKDSGLFEAEIMGNPCGKLAWFPGRTLRQTKSSLMTWLVVDLTLWKIWLSQLGWLFPIYGTIKTVPNHQPDITRYRVALDHHFLRVFPRTSVRPGALTGWASELLLRFRQWHTPYHVAGWKHIAGTWNPGEKKTIWNVEIMLNYTLW